MRNFLVAVSLLGCSTGSQNPIEPVLADIRKDPETVQCFYDTNPPICILSAEQMEFYTLSAALTSSCMKLIDPDQGPY